MRGLLGKAEQCQYLGVWRFGYSHDGDTITLDPATAPLAEKVHYDYLAGVPVSSIVEWLISKGVKTYAGNDPGYQFVTGILKNWLTPACTFGGRRKTIGQGDKGRAGAACAACARPKTVCPL